MSDSSNLHRTPPEGAEERHPSGDEYAPPAGGWQASEHGYGTDPAHQFLPQYRQDEAGVRPRSLVLAVRLMWGGAVLTALGAVVGFFRLDTMRAAMAQELAAQGMPELASPEFLGVLDSVLVVSLVAGAAIGVGLWCWMAVKNGQGRAWARVLSTVLAGVFVLNFLVSLGQVGMAGQQVLGLLQVALVVTTVVLMWQRASSDFYAARSARIS